MGEGGCRRISTDAQIKFLTLFNCHLKERNTASYGHLMVVRKQHSFNVQSKVCLIGGGKGRQQAWRRKTGEHHFRQTLYSYLAVPFKAVFFSPPSVQTHNSPQHSVSICVPVIIKDLLTEFYY